MTPDRAVAIVGIYATRQERASGRTLLSLTMEAIHGALDDAGLTLADVDGYIAHQFPAGNGTGPTDANIAYQLGGNIGFFADSTGARGVLYAAGAIRQGLANVVILPAAGSSAHGTELAGFARPRYEFTEWTGSMTAAQFALQARRHMHEYGTTREQLAQIAAIIHGNGVKNPAALCFAGAEMTVQDVLAARMIADPFTRPMCSLVNDGASCIVVASAERARDTRHAPVWVIGGSGQTRGNTYFEAPSLHMRAARSGMLAAFERAGVRHDDIDIVMCYDHFAYGPLYQFEVLGFCHFGEGGAYATEVMGLDGKHPVCPDGGNLAYSHFGLPDNFKQIEIVRQFRNDVADLCPDAASGAHTYDRRVCRKVRDPKLAVGCGAMTDGRHSITLLAKD